MKNRILLFTFLLLTIISVNYSKAEGLKELAGGSTNYPVTNFGSHGWADLGAPEELRLNIYIEDPTSESVYLGFNTNGEDYRIYDPNGVLVYSNTTNGNASSAAVTIAGPNQVIGSGGYNAQVYTPVAGSPSGNYYLAFVNNSNENYWDISVAKAGSTSTELGRVWSMIWWLNMRGWNAANSFEGTMYAYSTEGFVSKVDYNGSNFRPYVFSIYYNANGPGSSGDLEQDRKSINGANAGTPSFPVFLNPPPEAIMPSATFGDLVATPSITRTAATGPNKFSINLSSTQPGTFTVLLNVEVPGTPDIYDDVPNTKDRVLVYDIVPAPGETAPYIRAMPWDGIDGNGNVLADGYLLHYTVSYGDGRSNFPTYDAEYLADGLSVSQVRPINSYNVQLYWDDSNIPDDPTISTNGDFGNGLPTEMYHVELNGANTPSHRWVNQDYGNVNTINTWWFCNVKQATESVEALPPLAGSAPTIQAHDIVFSDIGNTAMRINWTNGNGSQRLVFVKQTNTGQPMPVDNTTYAANTTFGSGDQIGTTGWYCVYNGSASPEVFVTGLAENTEYRVMVCEYNNGSGSELYNTNTAVINPANETTITLTQATNVTFTNVLANSMTVNWTNGTGTRRAAFIKLTATAGNALPVNNITYVADQDYGVGDQIGSSGWYCIYNGTGTSVDITNLAANTDYTVMVTEYLGSNGNENYLTTTNATDPNNQVTATGSPAHHIIFSNVGTNSMDFTWTNGTGTDRYVFVKETNGTEDASPVDGTVYTANTTFGSGTQIGTTGWYCVYSGSGAAPTVSITGLSSSTYYRVKVCDYTGAQVFIPGSVPTNPLSQSTLGTTPTMQAHHISFPNTGSSSMDVNWVNGNGTKRIVFAKQGTTGSPTPVDATIYAANSGFGLGDQIGTTGWYCIYNGTGTSVTMNNILEDTDYRFKVCEYNTDGSGPLYYQIDTILNPNNEKSLTAGITVSTISQHTTELGGTATFTIVLNTQPTHDVVIGLSSDDATEGSVPASVTFTSANWNTPQTITVTGVDDAVFDGDITYNIITAAATSSDVTYNGIDPDDVVVINDDDESAPTVDLSASPLTIAENAAVSTLTATLSNASTQDVTVTLGYTGTATGSGTDYTASSTTIVISAGNLTGTATITSVDDAIYEGNETVIADITNVVNGTENGTQTATVTITDDESAPTVDLSASPLTIAENAAVSTLTATLSNASTQDVTVTLGYTGTATGSGTDYTASSTTIVISAGNLTGTATITSVDDAIYEGNETVIADITNVVNGTENGTQTATVTITDDESAPTVNLSASPLTIAENAAVSTLTATLSNASTQDVTVTIGYTGTATGSGTDYTANSTTIVISAGNLTGTATITSDDDALIEGDETVIVDITNVVNGTENGTQTATVTITDDDFGPTAQDDDITIPEDNGATNIMVLIDNGNGADDFGGDGPSTGTITIITGATNGTSVVNDNGTPNDPSDDYIVYTPNADWNGTETITYQICDATGDCDQATITITVNPVNDAPVVDNEYPTTNEDIPVNGDVTGGGDFDIDGNLIVTTTPVYGPSNGGIVVNPDGTYTYTPNPNWNGTDTIIIQICDDGTPLPAECVNDTIFVTVNPVNDAPVVDNEYPTTDEDNPVNGDVTGGGDFDIDGNLIVTTTPVYGPSNGGIVVNPDGTYTYTPNPNWNGTDTIIIQICDDGTPLPAECVNDTIFVTVNPVNDAPVVDNEYPTTNEDIPVNGDVTGGGDFDFDGNLIVTTTPVYGPSNGGIVVNPDGTYTYTPNPNWNGTDTIIIKICDDGTPLPAECVNDTIFVTVTPVNDAPVGGNETANIDEDNPGTVIDLDDNDTDPDGDALTVTFPNGNTGTGGGTFTDNGDGTVTYIPLPDYYGNDTLIYTVCDPTPACVTDTVVVTVNPINDAPVVDNENVGTMQDVPFSGDLTDIGDTDVDGTLTANTTPTYGPFNGGIVINPDGTYTYTPNAGFVGNDTIVVEICDDGYPTPVICVNDTIFITVTNNLTPTDNGGNGNENMSTTEDSSAVNSPNVLNNNTDPEGDPMTVTIVNPGNGTAVYNPADSTIAYTPNPDFCGQDTVLYDVCDAYTCNNDTLFVDVTCVNDAPIVTVNPVNETTPEDTPVTICIDATDVDGDAYEVSSAILDPNNGIATGFADGDSCFTYTPDPDFNGLDSLTVTVCDGNGACDTVSVIINVTPVNDNPVIVQDTIGEFTEINTPVEVCIPATDVDGDTLGICDINTMPTDGIVSAYTDTTLCFTYTPNVDYLGNDTLSLVVCDGNGGSDTVSVIITVTPPNEDPVIVEDTINTTTPVDTPVEVCIPATDADGDTLGICSINTMPTNGIVSNYTDTTLCFTYTPDAGFVGSDTLSVIVCDGNGGSDTVTIFIDVTPFTNNDPVIAEDTINTTTPVNTPVEVCIDATDVDGDTIGICSINTMPTNGIVSNYTDSTLCFTYTPDAGFVGSDTLSVIVCDGNGGSDTATIFIDVTPFTNNDPVIEEDTINTTTPVDTPVEVCIDATDADGDTIGICSINTMPTNGIVSNYTDSTLCFTYTPSTGYVGNDTMTIIVCDGNGGSDTVIVIIDVIPDINVDPVSDTDTISVVTDFGTPIEICVDATDADGDTIDICSVLVDPLYGNISGINDGDLCFTYTPNDNYSGEDIFTIIICDDNGGTDTVVISVTILPEEELFIPSGFSPNGDNVNDLFIIRGISENDNTSIIIYNRWGNKVYEASPYKNAWDGSSMFGITSGEKLPVGTYFYIFKLNDKVRKGYIYLNR